MARLTKETMANDNIATTRTLAAPLYRIMDNATTMTFGTDDAVDTTMTTSRVRTRVPSSNRRAILSVIDNQMNSAKVAWQTKYLTNVETNSSKVDFIINECIDKTGLCLKHEVEEMTTTEEDDNLSNEHNILMKQ